MSRSTGVSCVLMLDKVVYVISEALSCESGGPEDAANPVEGFGGAPPATAVVKLLLILEDDGSFLLFGLGN